MSFFYYIKKNVLRRKIKKKDLKEIKKRIEIIF